MLTAVVAAAVVTGCSGGSPDDEPTSVQPTSSSTTDPSAPGPTPTATVGPQYVALGDSYQAAPGVPETSGADGCFRSSGNYAQLVARESGLTVTDATCSGATTDSLLADQVPQITADAELVTVGIGGNDFDLFSRLISGCLDLGIADPSGSPCTDAASGEVDDTMPQIAANIGGVLDTVLAAAPDAQVLVVGYPDLLPVRGSCPDRLALATGDYAFVNGVTRALSDALRQQAESRGLDFVDVATPSRGHDICSDDPWINGSTVGVDGTIPFHPFGVEQQAIATMILGFL